MIKINDDTYQKFISDGNKIKIIKQEELKIQLEPEWMIPL